MGGIGLNNIQQSPNYILAVGDNDDNVLDIHARLPLSPAYIEIA
jgi:hypothetical protein